MCAGAVARTFRGSPANLRRLAALLRRGGLVAVPTETVYGLAGDATNPTACARIFAAKGRPSTDPLIVHIHSLRQLDTVAKEVPEAARQLARAFWPGPLTMVLPKHPSVSPLLTAGRESVAVRMPAHPLFRRLLRLTARPLAAPSANPFGYVSPTTAEHVRTGLGQKIDAILDGGPCSIGVESSIVDLRDPRRPVLLRPGAIEAAALARVLGRRVTSTPRTVQAGRAAVAPGMLSRHYSPRTPIQLHRRLPAAVGSTEARVCFRPPARPLRSNEFVLSPDGTGQTAAQRLFALLRDLDHGQWQRLHVQLAPARIALSEAINDRLRRSAAR